MLDSVTGLQMQQLLDSVPLADHLKRALVHQEGDSGRILGAVLAYERRDWGAVRATGLSTTAVLQAFWQSTPFASETAKMLLHLRPGSK